MMRTVHLYGSLAEKYGEQHHFDVGYPAEVAKALAVNFRGFQQDFQDGMFRFVVGDFEAGLEVDESMVFFKFGKAKDIHIVPQIAGAKGQKSSAAFKIIAGLALMTPFALGAAGLLGAGTAGAAGLSAGAAALGTSTILGTTAASLAMNIGLGMALGGVASLLSPAPKVKDYSSYASTDPKPSFLFNGPINTSAQGTAVPVVYGRFRCGSVILSSGLKAEKV